MNLRSALSTFALGAMLTNGQAIAQQDDGEHKGLACTQPKASQEEAGLAAAHRALHAKLPILSSVRSPAVGKAGASGGNVICRLAGNFPTFRYQCDGSDDLFARGAGESRTWATIDLGVWMRDSWVKGHGGEEKALERLRIAIGDANKAFARSRTKIQLRAARLIRLRDEEVTEDDLYLLSARFGVDFTVILADVSDSLGHGRCSRNTCGYAVRNGAAGISYAGHVGAWDQTATWSVALDVAGEYGTYNEKGEQRIAIVGDLGGLIAHELSHNMGADHFVPSGPTHLPYGKGYLIEWPTLDEHMANLYCGDATTGGAGTFSNPDLNCAGYPKGIPNEADAARAMRESRFEFASFSQVSKPVQGNFTGLWWTPTQPGVGWTITHQGDAMFVVWFTYDYGGQPMWLVASDLRRRDDESFQGMIYRVRRGTPFTRTAGAPVVKAADLEEVGTLSISFNDGEWGQASFDVVMDGKVYSDSKWLVRQHFGEVAPTCMSTAGSRGGLANYQDLWGSTAEPGWGMNLAHEGKTIFASWYTYDGMSGKPIWRVASAMERQGDGSFFGATYAVIGTPLDEIGGKIHQRFWGPVTNIAANSAQTAVKSLLPSGNARLVFANGEQGTLMYVSDGASTSKEITRLVIGPTVPACQ